MTSTHIHHLLFVFFTATILDNHIRNYTSLMKPAAFNLSISLAMTFYLFGANILFFYITLLTLRSTFSLWTTILGSNSNMFTGDQTNSLLFFLSNLVIYTTSTSVKSAFARVVLSSLFNSTLTNSLCTYILLSLFICPIL